MACVSNLIFVIFLLPPPPLPTWFVIGGENQLWRTSEPRLVQSEVGCRSGGEAPLCPWKRNDKKTKKHHYTGKKNSSYVRKSRREHLQSHIRITAMHLIQYMTKYMHISSYIMKPSTHMTLQPFNSEFPYFIFYQYSLEIIIESNTSLSYLHWVWYAK